MGPLEPFLRPAEPSPLMFRSCSFAPGFQTYSLFGGLEEVKAPLPSLTAGPWFPEKDPPGKGPGSPPRAGRPGSHLYVGPHALIA